MILIEKFVFFLRLLQFSRLALAAGRKPSRSESRMCTFLLRVCTVAVISSNNQFLGVAGALERWRRKSSDTQPFNDCPWRNGSNVFENFRRPCLASAVLLASLPTPAEFPFDLS